MAMAVAVGDQRRKKEAMDALVIEISKGSEQALFPAVRSALERGWTFSFMGTLAEAKKKKEAEIDRICSRHYGGFLNSVQEILKIRSSTEKLTTMIGQVHDEFDSVGKGLVQVLSALEVLENERESIRRVQEAMIQCREVSKLMVEAQELIAADDHYAALTIIERLQVEQNSVTIRPFVTVLQAWLPNMTSKLLDAARNAAESWLSSARSKCALIGSTVLKRYARISSTGDPNSSGKLSSFSVQYIQKNGSVFRLDAWASPTEFKDIIPWAFTEAMSSEGAQLLQGLAEQLAPIHRALHMYSVLGELRSFHEQCQKMRSPIISGFFEVAERDASKQGLLAVVPTLFSSICGFFVIECMCRQCVERADGYITWHELTSLWDSTCKKLENLCTANLHTIRNPDEAMLMKENILLLTEALADDAFSMRPQGLVSMMQIIWNRFEELQVEFIVSVCAHALDSCAYQPLSITTKERFDSQIKAFKLDKVRLQEVQTSSANQSAISAAISAGKNMSASATLDALEENMEIGRSSVSAAASAPDTADPRRKSLTGSTSSSRTQQFIAQTFPFSEAVPVILRELHLMITKFFAFAVKNKQLKSVGESVCMAVQKAFVGMSHTMLKKLLQDGAETPLSKACQISIDAATFAEVTNYLKTLLSGMLVHFKFVDSVENHLTTAIQTARKELADVSSHAQDLVFELLALKVDDLLGSLVFINWEPEQYPTGPHDSIEEVVDYLRATFMWLTHLPQAAREAAHFTCCSKVQSGIIDYILSPQVSRLNILSIVALEFDVRRLENFADSCGVRQLSLCFAELHELVRALLHPELPQFGDNPQLRRSLFPRLDPARLARVIEKMSASPPAAMGANLPRIDKKLVLTLSKKLKVQSKD